MKKRGEEKVRKRRGEERRGAGTGRYVKYSLVVKWNYDTCDRMG